MVISQTLISADPQPSSLVVYNNIFNSLHFSPTPPAYTVHKLTTVSHWWSRVPAGNPGNGVVSFFHLSGVLFSHWRGRCSCFSLEHLEFLHQHLVIVFLIFQCSPVLYVQSIPQGLGGTRIYASHRVSLLHLNSFDFLE